ncbi:D-Ala-D-Ala carboxypeptidase A. Serine peptidase. MEROPS family S11 [Bacillus sp. OV194]|nr:D-Ala-D-Ala carboxypeptidase A. Serine peptidase. MEROPS family S11 [Bacillus sp. OV194]
MFGNKLKGFTFSAVMVSMLSASVFGYSEKASAAPELKTKSETAILVDGDTGKILYENKADQVLPPASMSKMMTEYLVNEAIKKGKIQWDQKTAISDYAHKISQNRDLSNVPLRSDYKYSVKELYEAMAIYSANGASIALAELVGDGKESKFVGMMNDKAKKMGIKDARFVNSTGLNNNDLQGYDSVGSKTDENKMSAKSVGILAFKLISDYPEVLDTASIPSKWFRPGTDDKIMMKNWNWMLPSLVYGYKGVDGLKTGTTDNAGYSFAATAKRDGTRLISVLMKSNSYAGRFGETKQLLDYGFSNYTKETLLPKGYQLKKQKTLPVIQGKEKEVGIATKEPVSMLVKNGEKQNYKPVLVIDKKHLDKDGKLKAPLKKGETIGHIQLKYTGKDADHGYLLNDGSGKGQASVVTTKAVEKANWFVLAMRGTGHFFGGVWDSAVDTVKGWF